MLQLYGLAHNKIDGLTNYKELNIVKEINQDDALSFLFPISDPKHDVILEECYIQTKDNEYIVKEVNYSDDDWTEYICKINIEGIKGKDVSHFETVEQTCTDAVNLALVGTGWTIGSCDVVKLRTVRKNNCNAYDVLQEIQSAYGCEMSFDSINKKVYIYQSMGSDKGTYFAEQLNLKKLDVQRNSYDYITRLIPLGKDGLGIASINGGLNYIQNYQYSGKIITAYWEDNRYTLAQDLMDDGIDRLAYLSVPYKSYKADILDLSSNSTYSILDYSLGDTITLLAKSKSTKEKQRIIKLTNYPEEPERNTVEIANKILSLEVLQVRLIDAADTVDTVTTSDGLVDGTKVDGIDWSQLQNVHIVIADIQDLSVVTARIGTLEVTTAHITSGVIDNATIDVGKVNNLSANYATITNLNSTNGNITNLTSNVASINTLLAGNIGALNLAVGAIQAGSAVIGTEAIASAQIISLDVLKINAGNISTNKFTVQSDNGNLKMLGDTIKLWDVSGKERVSLGLNSGDYNLLIRGPDGTTVLFGTTGVTKAGITTGAVDDSKIDVNANISGGKLNISSVVSSINSGTTTLLSSKIALNATTLDLAFNSLSTAVSGQANTLSTQGTAISANATAISLKASQTDITTSINAIQIGGRNLITNSGNFKNTSNWVATGLTVVVKDSFSCLSLTGSVYHADILLKNATEYTYQCEIMFNADVIASATTPLHHWIGVSGVAGDSGVDGAITIEGGIKTLLANTWNKIILHFKTKPTGINYLKPLIYKASFTETLWLKTIKLEEGNKATDWVPSLEDVDGAIVSASNGVKQVRYIRDWLNGSSISPSDYWVEIKAFAGATNIALGKTSSYSSTSTVGSALLVTDGDVTFGGYYGSNVNVGLQNVTVDLGSVYNTIDYLQIWHYWLDVRICHATKTEVSADGVNWITLFDSAVVGEYAESSTGHIVSVNASNVTTRITTAEASIVTMAGQITLKATQVSLDTTNGNVTTAQNTANTANGTANALRDTTVPALTTRVSTAETKITADAIVSAVTSSTTYTDAMGLKTNSNSIISIINQSAELITINANKIGISGSTIDLSANISITSKVSNTSILTAINQSSESVKISAGKVGGVTNNLVEINDSHLRATFSDGSYSEMVPSGFHHVASAGTHDYHYLIYTGTATAKFSTSATVSIPSEFHGKDCSIAVAIKNISIESSDGKLYFLQAVGAWGSVNASNNTVTIYVSGAENSSTGLNYNAQLTVTVTFIVTA